VCYSHFDRKWLEAFQRVLKPLVRERVIDLWTDTRIEAGQRWRDEIGKSLKRAKVAVLLVSQDFLASDFIAQEELPLLLKHAVGDGLKIIWVAISASVYQDTVLVTPATAFEGKTARGNLGWWWLRVRGRHGP
jgi:hypothetical protein